MCRRKNKAGELRGDISAFRLVFTPSFRNISIFVLKKQTVKPGEAFEDTAFEC
jgi:hypothetical protein